MLRRTFLKALAALGLTVGLPVVVAKATPVPKIKKGDTIVCPECQDRIATAKRDIFGGDRVLSADFQAHGGYILFMAQMRCRCGTPYIKSTPVAASKVHTDRGWL